MFPFKAEFMSMVKHLTVDAQLNYTQSNAQCNCSNSIIDCANLEELNKSSNQKGMLSLNQTCFKFLEEKELRFKCSLLLIPRSLNNSPVELPKCSVTREELMKKLQLT
uniref:Uncharacterized protein n=1 Tax=Ditylenchus dipsaci TaxID=166011 RepID=A0A915DZH3_9BILA